MAVHYFTLRLLASEFNQRLAGGTIVEIFSQQKNELCLNIVSQNGDDEYMCISLEPGINSCVLRREFTRAKRNSVDLFTRLVNSSVERFWIHPSDRILFMKANNNLTFVLQLYNTAASNIVLLDGSEVVVGSFKREKELLGGAFSSSKNQEDIGSLNEQSLMNSFRQLSSLSVKDFLRNTVRMLGTIYTREIIFRSGVSLDSGMEELPEEQRRLLFQTILQIIDGCLHGKPYLYRNNEGEYFLSVVPLEHCNEVEVKEYESINDAINVLISRRYQENSFDRERKRYEQKLSRALETTKRTITAIQKEIELGDRASEYEQAGHTLMANLQDITKGKKEAKLQNIFDEESILHIQLVPALSPYQNAEKYFEKARKAKTARIEAGERLTKEQKQLESLTHLMEDLSRCETIKELKNFSKSLVKGEVSSVRVNKDDAIPFRVFTISGGFEVWVGKSSTNNDLLTMKYAKPNDLWFHARGVGGSHTLLRIPGGKISIPHEAIEQTASIAAYYSKMRKSKNVAVSYCERKYIRKPKHAPAGSVTLVREKVIFVEPHLP